MDNDYPLHHEDARPLYLEIPQDEYDHINSHIAELEESHKKEVTQLLMEIAELKADYKEACYRLQTANLIKDEQLAATRHQKYKRCLAMANYWGLVSVFTSREIQLKCMRRELQWYTLAEKFKEAK